MVDYGLGANRQEYLVILWSGIIGVLLGVAMVLNGILLENAMSQSNVTLLVLGFFTFCVFSISMAWVVIRCLLRQDWFQAVLFYGVFGLIIGGISLFFQEEKPKVYKSSYSVADLAEDEEVIEEDIDIFEYERTDDYLEERSYEEYGDYDCDDFYSQEEAQEFFEEEGGPYDDYHNLDRDGDGYVCENL